MSPITKIPIAIAVFAIASLFVAGPASVIKINTKMFRSNNTKITTVLIIVALATVIIIGPQITRIGDILAKQKYSDWEDCRDDHSKNWCKNYFKNHDDDNGNRASQGIGQSQSSSQNSQVVSGGDSIGSGNNFNFQNQENSGNNALAQQ